MIYCGAMFNGDNNRGFRVIYADPAYGASIPFIRNTLMEKAFKFLMRYIHFSDGSKQKRRGQTGYSPLFKVSEIVNKISSAMRASWLPGEKITVDESMIRYHGRAIAFVQYMPRKPIKHGIKVFAVCFAYSGVMLGFEVYCGADDTARITPPLQLWTVCCKTTTCTQLVVGSSIQTTGILRSRLPVTYTRSMECFFVGH